MSESAETNDIVISGAGLVASLGDSPEAVWQRVRNAECGFGSMSALEHPLPEGHSGAQAVDLPADFEPTLPREVRYLRFTILQALGNATLDPTKLPYAAERCGVVLGTTLHGVRAGGQYFRTGDFAVLKDFLAGATLQRALADLPFAADFATTCSACSSSLGSIALAMTLLASGELDLVIAGGYDATSEYAYAGFNSLRLVAPGPLRPFAQQRLGMKLGEGYGIVVLERAAAVRSRNTQAARTHSRLGRKRRRAPPHAAAPARRRRGVGDRVGVATARISRRPTSTSSPPTRPAPPTTTPPSQARVLRTFGTHRVPVVAFKSHLGHTLGGAGAVELILSAMALRHQMIPGCCNVDASEIEFRDLNLSLGKARAGTVRATLNSSLGFGGANTCVVLTPADNATPRSSDARPSIARDAGREVCITGVGVVLPDAIGNDAFIARLSGPVPDRVNDSGQIPEEQYIGLLNARRVRRMSEYVKLTLAATSVAMHDAGLALPSDALGTWSAILGSTHGSAKYCHDYYKQVVEEGLSSANPMLFAEGVPNAAAAHLSLMLAVKGACQTIIGTRTAGLDALRLAALRISTGQWERAIVSAGEEYFDVVNRGYAACGLYNASGSSEPGAETGFAVGCGAVTIVLESRDSAAQRNARIRGTVAQTATTRLDHGNPLDHATRALQSLGGTDRAFTSANSTWIDRFESATLDKAGIATRTSLYGRWPELFSVTPLASLAAGLLDGANAARSFAVLATGFTGTFTAAKITRA